MDTSTNSNQFTNAHAIVVGAFLIAIAIIITGRGGGTLVNNQAPAVQPTVNLAAVRPVSSEDHSIGNEKAPVTVIVYSDFECPFCKSFHESINTMRSEYGSKVRLVYRHFPLENIHPSARIVAHASECVNSISGNATFWKFVDEVFRVTGSNNAMKDQALLDVVSSVGVDTKIFEACMNTGEFNDRITADAENAQKTGGQGTPWTIVIAQNGRKFDVSGAVPYDTLKGTIEKALAEK